VATEWVVAAQGPDLGPSGPDLDPFGHDPGSRGQVPCSAVGHERPDGALGGLVRAVGGLEAATCQGWRYEMWASFQPFLALMDREALVRWRGVAAAAVRLASWIAPIHLVAWVLCGYTDESPARLVSVGCGACGRRSPPWRRR
jgi:hypothetical protein